MARHYNVQEVKEKLSIDDIYVLLNHLGAEPQQMNNEYIVSKTICHGGNSRKLYYYDNSKMFVCFTHCNDPFDIFELLMKINRVELDDAVNYVVDFFNMEYRLDEVSLPSNYEDWEVIKRYEKNSGINITQQKVVLPEIDRDVISHYPKPHMKQWEEEGISKEMMDYYDIRFNPTNQSIIIPHTDENNRLVGIRQRTLLDEQQIYGKYRPATFYDPQKREHITYNHPLGFNLYGLGQAKPIIQQYHKAIVVEGEKSVLKIGEYLGLQNQIAVAVCGKNISQYQLQLLLDNDVNEIVIAFDADYNKFGDQDCIGVIRHLQSIYNRYNGFVNISFMWDKTGEILSHKMSPADAGKEAFLKLFRERITL